MMYVKVTLQKCCESSISSGKILISTKNSNGEKCSLFCVKYSPLLAGSSMLFNSFIIFKIFGPKLCDFRQQYIKNNALLDRKIPTVTGNSFSEKIIFFLRPEIIHVLTKQIHWKSLLAHSRVVESGPTFLKQIL